MNPTAADSKDGDSWNDRIKENKMPHQVNRRQKPAWKQVRRPLPPPSKPHSTKKGKRGYDRKDQDWKKDVAES